MDVCKYESMKTERARELQLKDPRTAEDSIVGGS